MIVSDGYLFTCAIDLAVEVRSSKSGRRITDSTDPAISVSRFHNGVGLTDVDGRRRMGARLEWDVLSG